MIEYVDSRGQHHVYSILKSHGGPYGGPRMIITPIRGASMYASMYHQSGTLARLLSEDPLFQLAQTSNCCLVQVHQVEDAFSIRRSFDEGVGSIRFSTSPLV